MEVQTFVHWWLRGYIHTTLSVQRVYYGHTQKHVCSSAGIAAIPSQLSSQVHSSAQSAL